jgi:hypothetical protein
MIAVNEGLDGHGKKMKQPASKCRILSNRLKCGQKKTQAVEAWVFG